MSTENQDRMPQRRGVVWAIVGGFLLVGILVLVVFAVVHLFSGHYIEIQ